METTTIIILALLVYIIASKIFNHKLFKKMKNMSDIILIQESELHFLRQKLKNLEKK